MKYCWRYPAWPIGYERTIITDIDHRNGGIGGGGLLGEEQLRKFVGRDALEASDGDARHCMFRKDAVI